MSMDDIDLDDYSDVALIAIMLIGTSENNKIDDVVRIHKMAFLADKIIADPDLDEDFNFDANKFGPFSENLEETLTKLKNWGIIKPSRLSSSKGSELTEDGRRVLALATEKFQGISQLCLELNDDLKSLTTQEIIKLVYRLYPSLTNESIIKNNLVHSNKIDSFSIPISGNGTHTILSENGTKYNVQYKDENIVTISELIT
jgi:uncharacterized protein YwgA